MRLSCQGSLSLYSSQPSRVAAFRSPRGSLRISFSTTSTEDRDRLSLAFVSNHSVIYNYKIAPTL